MTTLDDLSAYVNAGRAFKIACSEEFVTSPAALPSAILTLLLDQSLAGLDALFPERQAQE